MSSTNPRRPRTGYLYAAALGALLAILVTQAVPRLLRLSDSPSGRMGETFVMTRTGGVAGEQLLLVVNPLGTYLVSGAGPGQPSTTGTLAADDLAALARALDGADLDHRRPVHSDHCADQRHYTFSYGDAYYATDDCPTEPAVVARLRHQLEPLIGAARG